MTIAEAIQAADTLHPNNYTQAEKARWLSILDGVIKTEIIDTHKDGEDVVFNGYDRDTPVNTVLLVGAPYDNIYVKWLCAQYNLAEDEIDIYNNSMEVFNNAFEQFERAYNRAHMPLGTHFKYFS